MINKQYYLALLVLAYFSCIACKKKVQADYENALSKGVVLIEGDTVQATLYQTLLFDFSFADGVNPIHYTWEIYQQDTLKFRYLGTEEFHFAKPDVVGGPAAGIHSYKTLQKGIHRIIFYNPFYNEEALQKRQKEKDIYLTWKAIKEDFSSYDSLTDWRRQDFENYWDTLQQTPKEKRQNLWKTLYQHTYTIDSLPDSTTLQSLLIDWASQYTPYTSNAVNLELIDTLLGASYATVTNTTWHKLRNQQDTNAPLLPNSKPKIYYVRVASK